MRKYLKYFSSFLLIPFTRWYLRKERIFKFSRCTVSVHPGVFHPGLFSSTKFILNYLTTKDLAGKTFLELGCGTGLISVYAARQGATVTASDISTLAIVNCKANASLNNVLLSIVQSDLFSNIPKQNFDVVVINPPYYANDPSSEADYAWNCGKDFQYFRNLFLQLPDFTDERSEVIMVLTKGCDLRTIFSIAKEKDYTFHLLREKNVLFDEKDFLYEVRKRT